MKRLITLTVCLALLHTVVIADGPADSAGDPPALETPKFGGGGPITFKRWILRNLDLSGSALSEGDGVRGTVSFTVAKNGKLRELDVSQLGESLLTRRIESAVAASPAWVPALENGKPQARPVKVLFDLRLKRDAAGELYAEDIAAYTQADKSPVFRGGGPREFQQWMVGWADSLLGESVEAMRYRVSVRFVVERDGTMSDISLQARQGRAPAKRVREARYAVPVWSPAVLDGEPVRFRASMSLDFSAGTEPTRSAESADSTGLPAPYLIADQMPRFRSGDLSAFRKWVMENVKYPSEMYREGVEGRVMVSFVIERDGSLSTIEVLRSPRPELTDAVVEVLESSPLWTPGMQRGETVRVKYTLPVDFRIPQGRQAPAAEGMGRNRSIARPY